MAEFTRKPVENLLLAKSVAIIGASPKGRWPMGILRNLKKAYGGKVFLINPNYQEIEQNPCYPNLAALPEVPEELLILIPTRAVLGTLEEAAKLGVKAATIYTSGFGEGDDLKGKERGQAMKGLCEKSGFVICGPNCMGSYSLGNGLWTFPTVTPLLKKGPVGLVFQSGGSLGNWIKGASERGIGFTHAVSSGNEVSLDLVDYMSFLIDDPDTKVIALMVEGVLRRVLLAHGLEMERGDYRLIAKGTTEYRLDSMIQGETFAGVLNAPWDAKAAAAGMVRFADHREVLPDYPGGVFAVARKWAMENRELVLRYLRVWNDALRWAHEEMNRGEALKLIASEEKLDEKSAARKLAQLPASDNLNLSGLQSVLGLRVQFNLTPPMGTKLSSYYDEAFYQAATS